MIVLAGGESSRMGRDKCLLEIAGRSLLDHVLDGLRARRTVVVGPIRPTSTPVSWTQELPPGGGPVAGIESGLAALDSSTTQVVVVVAADSPFAPRAVPRLLDALPGYDAAVLVDEQGNEQPLIAAYRKAALEEAIWSFPTVRDAPARALLARVHHAEVLAENGEAFDCDDEAALARARALMEPT